ncbi:uncharacterized protein LOC125067025 isoform X1 [Vanessa atalanta]|uniref:uncharacterized protein LOC125067025 isoform X1 n=1 Tax=Vanessa atalanta TaxID=42275 RepID=UPI001FCD7FD0|nr:uncharacterized protein LOC125067025 isoform X1 [Vanessa atalanta]
MEAGRARNRDDNPGLPTLSLGLSSVRHIVTKLEAEYARAVTSNVYKSEIVKYNPCTEHSNDYYDFAFDPKVHLLNRFVVNLGVALSKCIPSVTLANFGFIAVTTGLFAPRMISYLVVYPFCRLVFGTLYPAYASYKAVRTKNLKEYVKWMMYWIVFALFTCTETFTDVFLSWFPFYYEVKIVLVLWLLSPATKGSSILYRKFVHPALCRREQEIDEYIAKAKDQGYHTVLNLGTKGVNYATTVIMQTAIKGGGGLVQQLRKSYSLSDLSECEPREERAADEADDVLAEPRLIRRSVKSGYATRRSASESNSRSPMYFPEVDVDVRPARGRMDEPDFSHIKSTEDISSGYSSAENSSSLTRTSSVGGAGRRARASRTAVTAIKRPPAAEDNQVIIEEHHDDDSIDYTNMPPLVNFSSPLFLSHTDPPFIYQYVEDQVKIIQVLGNYPLSNNSNNHNGNSDKRDQTEATVETQTSSVNNYPENESIDRSKQTEETVKKDSNTDIPIDIDSKPSNSNNTKEYEDNQLSNDINKNCKSDNNFIHTIDNTNTSSIDAQASVGNVSEEVTDSSFFDTSPNDGEKIESDEEASFETPISTPKSSRKLIKGKYGKSKAPLPPKANELEGEELHSKTAPNSEDSLININPNILEKENESLETINAQFSIANEVVDDIIKKSQEFSLELNEDSEPDKERSRKSISPAKVSKGSSALGKLFQLPSKLVFWHKTDDKSITDTNLSDISRKSSIENINDEFQSCPDLNTHSYKNEIPQIEITQASFEDDASGEKAPNDILEKSDALQKVINEKLENHPEYKLVSLHEEIPTTSKCTDV